MFYSVNNGAAYVTDVPYGLPTWGTSVSAFPTVSLLCSDRGSTKALVLNGSLGTFKHCLWFYKGAQHHSPSGGKDPY